MLLSITRNGNVALSIIRNGNVALSILRKRHVACRYYLKAQKGPSPVSILEVYTHRTPYVFSVSVVGGAKSVSTIGPIPLCWAIIVQSVYAWIVQTLPAF